MKYTVHKGKSYEATIQLSFFQRIASNAAVAQKFQEVGFTGVKVTGSGATRVATGSWPHDDRTADMPSQVVRVREI
jgi:hypothetical protein